MGIRSLILRLLLVSSFSYCAITHAAGYQQVSEKFSSNFDVDSIVVRFAQEDQLSPRASVEQLSWMVGRWESIPTNKSFSGGSDHAIFEPVSGKMPGLVSVLKKDGSHMLFELTLFLEIDGSITYRNRHFSPDAVAWQEPESYIDRRLVALEENAAYFDGITFVNISPQYMGVSFVLTDESGEQKKYSVKYTKKPL